MSLGGSAARGGGAGLCRCGSSLKPRCIAKSSGMRAWLFGLRVGHAHRRAARRWRPPELLQAFEGRGLLRAKIRRHGFERRMLGGCRSLGRRRKCVVFREGGGPWEGRKPPRSANPHQTKV